MNILLVQPLFKKREKSYPLGLGYIGAVLQRDGHNVFGLDLSFNTFEDAYYLINKNNIKLIGISSMSYNFKNAIFFCREIKKHTHIPIVAGGPHITIFKEKIFYEYKDCFDYLITGEGEYSFVALVNQIEKRLSPNSVDNLIYYDNTGIVNVNESGKEVNNLDDVPFPDRALFPVFKYKGMLSADKNYTQIITSRGCNHQCSYCPESTLWHKWRGRSITNVLEEIKSIIDVFGIREFHIEDSNFFGGGIYRIRQFCQRLIDERLNIRWQVPNGIPVMDFTDESILELMASAGCYSICLGIESFDKNILHNLRRTTDLDRVKRIVKSAHKAGLEVIGYFIIGFPGQNFKNVKSDFFSSRKLKLDFIQRSIFHLIPGSSLYDYYSHNYNFDEIINKNVSVSKVSIKLLKIIRIVSSFLDCTSPRYLFFIFKSLFIIKNPIKFIQKVICNLLGKELIWIIAININ